MGTNAAVHLANIYVAYLLELNPIFPQASQNISKWFRYIDDIFLIFNNNSTGHM
jgi:hypothetical protein